jgi:hypothetical protein
MTVVDYQAARVRRIDAQSAQRWLARAGLVAVITSPLLAMGTISVWLDNRLARYEKQAASGGLMAVINSRGDAYEFEIVHSGEWTPAEAMYFEKLEDVIDCTRGLRMPRTASDKSCWPKVYTMLGADAERGLTAEKKMTEYLQQFGKDTPSIQASFAKHEIEVEILAGSTKSEDGRYRLQWRERERATGRDEIWSGLFAVSHVKANKEAVAAGNAIGMRIDSFTWQRDQKVGGR